MNKLKVSNLSYSYKKHKALKEVSFEVSDGLVGILGENGAGKSTLIKLISTLFTIQSGEITLNNMNYNKEWNKVRGSIGYLPQDFSVYDNLTGREFLEIISSLKIEGKKEDFKNEAKRIVKEIGMEKFIDKRINEYSGGMKQKLGFAQALVGNPKLLILDEPTVGLDPQQRNVIRELFPFISLDKIVLVTTHIVEDIENYCKYLIVMKEGRIIFKGEKKEFVNSVKDLLWEGEVKAEELLDFKEKYNIIETSIDEERIRVKYISEKPAKYEDTSAKVSLQDAYIIHYEINKDV